MRSTRASGPRSRRTRSTSDAFDALACDVFAHQFRWNAPYARVRAQPRHHRSRAAAHRGRDSGRPRRRVQRRRAVHGRARTRRAVVRNQRHDAEPQRAALPRIAAALRSGAAGRLRSRDARRRRAAALRDAGARSARTPALLARLHDGDGRARTRRRSRPAGICTTTRIDVARLRADVARAHADGVAVCVATTAFALVALLDELDAAGRTLPLPPGSRVMETGGFKGRTRVVGRDELYARAAAAFAIDESAIVAEYGMTELSSQYYDSPASRWSARRIKLPVPWLRPIVVDVTGKPLPDGIVGAIRHIDCANRSSVVADRNRRSRRHHARRFAAARPRGRRRAARLLVGCGRPPAPIAPRCARCRRARSCARSRTPPRAGPTPIFRRACARPRRSGHASAIRRRSSTTRSTGSSAASRADAHRARRSSTNSVRSSVLDGFVERAGRPAAWARGANAVTIVSSDTTIGVAIAPLVFALCRQVCGDREGSRRRARRRVRRDAGRRTAGAARGDRRARVERRRRRHRDADARRRRRRRRVRRQRCAARDSRALRERCDVRSVRPSRERRLRHARRRSPATSPRSPPASRATRCSTTATAASRCTCSSSSAHPAQRTNASSTRWPARARRTRSNFRPDRASRRAPRASARMPPRPHFAPPTAAAACCARPTARGRSSSIRRPDELPPFGGGVIPVVFVDGVGDAAAYVAAARAAAAGAGRRVGRRRRARTGRAARRGARRAVRRDARPAAGRTSRRARADRRLHPLGRPRVSERFERVAGPIPGPRSRELNALVAQYEARGVTYIARRLSDRVGLGARRARHRCRRQPLPRSHRRVQRRRARPHERRRDGRHRGASAPAGARHGRRSSDRREGAAARAARRRSRPATARRPTSGPTAPTRSSSR